MLSALNRYFEDNRWVGDALIAGIALIVLTLAAVANLGQHGAAVALTFLLVLPLFARRTWPLTMLAATVALCLIQVVVLGEPIPGDLVIPIVIHAAAAYIPDRRWGYAALGVGVVGAGLAAVRWSLQSRFGYGYSPLRVDVGQVMFLFLAGVAVVAVAYLLGVRHRERRDYAAEQLAALADRNKLLAAERDTRAEMSAAAERARIARELHDIVAHALAVVVVQADGGAAAARTNPEMAPQVLETIAGTSRDALAQMRRMVSVLRAGPDGHDGRHQGSVDYAPAPGPGEIGELVEQVRAAGLPVTIDIIGTHHDMTDDAGLAVYRMVQESLTNVLKHAGPGATCRVVLHYGSAEVVVTVSDDGRGVTAGFDGDDAASAHDDVLGHDDVPGYGAVPDDSSVARGDANTGNTDPLGGHGLPGMRERVGLQGGTVHAGPKPDGGFEVTATVPYGVSE